jgi:hypothetical protein
MMRGKLPNVFAALVPCAFLLAASPAPPASAQTPAQQSQERAAPPPPPREASAQDDLSITAHVTARELRFDKVPNPKVEFTGRPRRETAWESERENLPQQVRPGVTYRDIGITLRITSVFADIDRIVAEALGELPPSDDAQPSPPGQTDTPPARPDDTAPAAQQVSPAPAADAQTSSRRTPSPPKARANAAKTTRRARAGRVR